MSLAGNLNTIAFADILQLLTAGKKTGILDVTRNNRVKQISFRDGDIIFAQSANTAEDMLGALLLKRGSLSKADLERAIVLHKQSGRPLGETLISMKVFSEQDIAECLRMQVEEIVYNLFSWPDGEFNFRDGAEPAEAPFLLELSTMAVIMEGTRRIDEWMEIQKVLPNDDVLLRMASIPISQIEDIKIGVDEFRLLPLITGERTAPQIVDMSPIGEFPSCRALYRLIVSGHVESAGKAVSVSITGMENEEEVVLNLIFHLYNSCFKQIRAIIEESFGVDNPPIAKFFVECDAPNRSGLMKHFASVSGGQGDSVSDNDVTAFNRFYASMIKLPQPIRLHALMNALDEMLTDQLELVFRFLGSGRYRGAVSLVKKEISDPLATRRELVMRYQIDENFYAALGRADRIVKSAIG